MVSRRLCHYEYKDEGEDDVGLGGRSVDGTDLAPREPGANRLLDGLTTTETANKNLCLTETQNKTKQNNTKQNKTKRNETNIHHHPLNEKSRQETFLCFNTNLQ